MKLGLNTPSKSVRASVLGALGVRNETLCGTQEKMDESFLNVAQPMYFKGDDKEWPFFGTGTCFLCNSKRHYYLITAAHVLSNLNIQPNQMFLFPHDKSRQNIQLSNYYKIKGPVSDDCEYQDLALYRISERNTVKRQEKLHNSFNLDSFTTSDLDLTVGDSLLFFGYPHQQREIDYDAKQFMHASVQVSAHYDGMASLKHCCKISFDAPSGISDMNGFSGSPVFWLKEKPNGKMGPRFSGLIIRAGIHGGTGNGVFVGAEVIKQLIAQTERETSS